MTNTYRRITFRNGKGNRAGRISRRQALKSSTRCIFGPCSGRKSNGFGSMDDSIFLKDSWDSNQGLAIGEHMNHYYVEAPRLFYIEELRPCITYRKRSKYKVHKCVEVFRHNYLLDTFMRDECDYWYNGHRHIYNY